MYVGLARFNNDASNMEAKGARSKQASNEKAASTSPTCHLADHSSQCAMARAALQNSNTPRHLGHRLSLPAPDFRTFC